MTSALWLQLKVPIADKYEFVLGSRQTEKTIVEKFRAEPRLVLDVSSQQPLELTVTRSAVNLLKGIVEVGLLLQYIHTVPTVYIQYVCRYVYMHVLYFLLNSTTSAVCHLHRRQCTL